MNGAARMRAAGRTGTGHRRSSTNRSVVGIVLLIALAACADKEPPAPKPAAGSVAADRVAGQAIAQRSCVACHRDDGTRAVPGIPHLAGQNEAYLVRSVRDYAVGKRIHAVLKDMTPQLGEADIGNVAAYYAGLAPVPSDKPAAPASPYERGRASAAACAGCHGVDGNSVADGTPHLAGQQPQYLLTALTAYHRGDRGAPALSTMLQTTDKVALESLALFYASQTPAAHAAPAVGDPVAGVALAFQCNGCHGLRGISNDAATPTLAGQDAAYLVSALKAYRTTSRRHEAMQGQLRELGDRDVQDLAAYYAVQRSRPAESGQNLIPQLADKCNRCHGYATDTSSIPVPRLGGQDKDYLVMALRAYRDDRRENPVMHKMSLPFSEAAIDGIASYYAGRSTP